MLVEYQYWKYKFGIDDMVHSIYIALLRYVWIVASLIPLNFIIVSSYCYKAGIITENKIRANSGRYVFVNVFQNIIVLILVKHVFFASSFRVITGCAISEKYYLFVSFSIFFSGSSLTIFNIKEKMIAYLDNQTTALERQVKYLV